MSTLKAQIKIGTINELGNKLDDFKEVAEKEIPRCEGYDRCLKELEDGLQSIFERVDIERDEGKFDEVKEALEVAKIVKQFLTRVQGSIVNLRLRNEKVRFIAEGKVLGLKASIDAAKKMMDAEVQKVQDLETAARTGTVVVEEDGTPVHQGDLRGRPVGVHPGDPLADRRGELSPAEDLDARRAAAKAAKANGKSPPAKTKKTRKKRAVKRANASNG